MKIIGVGVKLLTSKFALVLSKIIDPSELNIQRVNGLTLT